MVCIHKYEKTAPYTWLSGQAFLLIHVFSLGAYFYVPNQTHVLGYNAIAWTWCGAKKWGKVVQKTMGELVHLFSRALPPELVYSQVQMREKKTAPFFGFSSLVCWKWKCFAEFPGGREEGRLIVNLNREYKMKNSSFLWLPLLRSWLFIERDSSEDTFTRARHTRVEFMCAQKIAWFVYVCVCSFFLGGILGIIKGKKLFHLSSLFIIL